MTWAERIDAAWGTITGFTSLASRTLRQLRAMRFAAAAEQTFILANRSIFFITVVLAFTGAIMVIQACTQALRLLGDLTPIGPTFLQLVVREFGPTIVGLMVAARYGAGVGAELATMTITEQIDALRLAGATPEAHLVAPRLVAGCVGMLPLAVWGTAVAYFTGGVVAHHMFDVAWGSYWRITLTTPTDVAVGVCKALCYGVAIPLISCHAGLSARGGAPGVGQATTRAVIGASMAVLFLDLVVGATAHVLT